MQLTSNPRALSWLVLGGSLIVALCFWRWAEIVLAPADTTVVRAEHRPVGNNSDLYPRWLGAREVLLHHRDPYGEDITREIQTGFYGRPLDPRNPHDPVEEESFVYPLYVVFLLAPTVTLPFHTVVGIFHWLVLLAIAGSVPLWMYAIGLHPPLPITLSAMLLTLSSFPAVEEYFQLNLTALVVFFLAAATAAAARHWMTLCGFLLALATAKPDITALLILWLMLWAAAKWKERQRLIYSFAVTMVVLVLAAEALSPHWIGHFVAALTEYPTYGTGPSVVGMLAPSSAAWLISAGLVVLLAVYAWKWRHEASGSRGFAWTLAWVVCVTLAVLPKPAAYNQLLLIPAMLVLFARYQVITRAGRLSRALVHATFACLVWVWFAAALLAIGSLWISVDRLRSVAMAPLYTLWAIPAIAFLAVLVATIQFSGSPIATA